VPLTRLSPFSHAATEEPGLGYIRNDLLPFERPKLNSLPQGVDLLHDGRALGGRLLLPSPAETGRHMPLGGRFQVALRKVSIDLTESVYRFGEPSVGEGEHATVTLVGWLKIQVAARGS
jgi:hypothetical protein